MSTVTASVVVPCRDAAALLPRQMAALAAQRWAGSWEVVVADNGSRDGSAEVARAFADRLPALAVIDASARQGPAHARNAGAAAARGERLLFCDADDEVGEGWLAALAAALDEHALVCSRFETARLNPPWAAREHAQAHGPSRYDYPPFLPHAGGSGLGLRRELFTALGGFDESLSALEDTDLCWRAQLAGTPLAWVREAVVHVRLRADLAGTFRQHLLYGRYNVLAYRRYRARGMPRLPLSAGLLRWGKLAATAPRLLAGRPARHEWVGQLGWRLGRLAGCFAYRALAP
jgi:glycosyltransferase involved in cell wall biosynthesis